MRLPKHSSSCIAIFLLLVHGCILLGRFSHVSALVVAISKNVGQKTTTKPYATRRLERRLVLNSQCQESCITFAKNDIPAMILTSLLSGLLTFSEPQMVVAAVVAPSPPTTGMLCATQQCQTQLTNCMKDSSCAPGMACLLRCQLQPKRSEGSCQVRCMDLYEDEAMQALTDCTLTEHACYPPLPPANDYVPISDESLEVKAFDLRTLQGRWYVAAGGNPAFDCFPCAQHEFRYNDKDKPPRLEATFSYRIARDDGSVFTRRGDKLITQKGNNGKLELRLDPDRMKYRDDWTVLANEPDEDYVVVYYHGTNVAWDGYGGLNVYTRSGRISESQRPGIERGLAKVGLSLSDLTVVDNSCNNPIPLQNNP